MKRLCKAAVELCEGRLCVVLEGGYAPEALAHGVENTALAMLGEPLRTRDTDLPEVHPDATARVDEHLDQIVEIHRTRLAL
jgi:acetoin utilization deacetylase AcuC-like enzyme